MKIADKGLEQHRCRLIPERVLCLRTFGRCVLKEVCGKPLNIIISADIHERVVAMAFLHINKDKTENKLLTQNVAIGLDGRKHRRNLNVLVCGGSGAGKTRFYAKPNIMNANTSFVVLDPKGELLRDTGHLLEEKGYEIKVLDLIDMEKFCSSGGAS